MGHVNVNTTRVEERRSLPWGFLKLFGVCTSFLYLWYLITSWSLTEATEDMIDVVMHLWRYARAQV